MNTCAHGRPTHGWTSGSNPSPYPLTCIECELDAAEATPEDAAPPNERTIVEAIETWYSAHYPFGVRLRSQERANLAAYVAQRLGCPNLSEGASAPSGSSDEGQR